MAPLRRTLAPGSVNRLRGRSSLPTVSVIGSGTRDRPDLTEPLGSALARRGVDLITGGGRGVMAGVCRSFTGVPERAGRCIGILPAHPDRPGEAADGYPNPWVEIAIRTHLAERGETGDGPGSRNHLVVLSGGVVVALPGGAGTRSELRLAARYRRPVLLLGWPREALADEVEGGPGSAPGPRPVEVERSWRQARSVEEALEALDPLLAG